MSSKVDVATGAISVAVFGLQATLTPSDLELWVQVVVNAAPAFLIIFLIWRLWKMDRQHMECTKNWAETRQQLAMVYAALVDETKRCHLPSQEDFMSGKVPEAFKGERK